MMHVGEMEAATHRLNRGRLLLEQQRARVARLAAQGLVSDESMKLLREMERALTDLERHLDLLQREEAEEMASLRS